MVSLVVPEEKVICYRVPIIIYLFYLFNQLLSMLHDFWFMFGFLFPWQVIQDLKPAIMLYVFTHSVMYELRSLFRLS